MKNTTETSALSLLANDAGYDPLEDRLRENIRSTIEAVFEEELAQFLGRCRYGREDALRQGYRNGHRERQLTGTFGTERVSVPRARIVEEDGRASEWRSRALPRYQRLTRKAEALIASVYLSGTNTRRVKRALFGLFRGAVSKDVVSRAWRKVKVDWDAWCSRGLADEDIVRLILDGTVIKTRLDRKATNISVLAAIGVRRDGQKVLLSIGNMGGERKCEKKSTARLSSVSAKPYQTEIPSHETRCATLRGAARPPGEAVTPRRRCAAPKPTGSARARRCGIRARPSIRYVRGC